MDVNQIREKITRHTKAIMVVHIYGLPVDIEPIIEIARERNVRIIEDAAQMHGQTYKGECCGSFGDISTFSFYPNKHITTGEGGMVVTNDDSLAETCRSLRNLCFEPQRRFVHERLGWNFRMTNMQAAIGLAQLERLEEFVEKKRHIGSLYNELLQDIPGIRLPVQTTDYAENIYWVYGVVLEKEIGADAREIMRRLSEEKIGTRPFFWPMHEQPVLKRLGLFSGENYPIAEEIARRGFYLPSGLALTDNQIRRAANSLKRIINDLCA